MRRGGGVPAGSTERHAKQFVLFSFYLQFPETEQNNFLYTYKAQKEKTTKLSKKRGRKPPTPAGRASEATPWTLSWKSGCGLLCGGHAKELSPRKNPQINPDRQPHGEEEGEEAQEASGQAHTLLPSEASPTTPRPCPRGRADIYPVPTVGTAVLSRAGGGQMRVHS